MKLIRNIVFRVPYIFNVLCVQKFTGKCEEINRQDLWFGVFNLIIYLARIALYIQYKLPISEYDLICVPSFFVVIFSLIVSIDLVMSSFVAFCVIILSKKYLVCVCLCM